MARKCEKEPSKTNPKFWVKGPSSRRSAARSSSRRPRWFADADGPVLLVLLQLKLDFIRLSDLEARGRHEPSTQLFVPTPKRHQPSADG